MKKKKDSHWPNLIILRNILIANAKNDSCILERILTPDIITEICGQMENYSMGLSETCNNLNTTKLLYTTYQ